jgi:D-alanyl-D-alanine dipeptidase
MLRPVREAVGGFKVRVVIACSLAEVLAQGRRSPTKSDTTEKYAQAANTIAGKLAVNLPWRSAVRLYPSLHLIVAMFSMNGCAPSQAEIEQSAAKTFAEADLMDIRTVVPDIALDIRYATRRNFVGARIDGYDAAKCYLKSSVAAALRRVETELRTRNLRLKIFDCYRPARAVGHFVVWANDMPDQRTKAEFYPNLEKSKLLGEYIAPMSGHSRGATLDVTLLQCEATSCTELDMGTPFDFFDVRAHTDAPSITAAQRTHRDLLRDALGREGFENYAAEWWHYTFKPEPTPDVIYDVPIR